MTAVSSEGKSFIVDGRKLKSINQWYNKELSRLASIKDKQHYGYKLTRRQKAITHDRNNKAKQYDVEENSDIIVAKMEGTAYIVFSRKLLYMGCNEYAAHLFPELLEWKVEKEKSDMLLN